jgi:hypothetical protein
VGSRSALGKWNYYLYPSAQGQENLRVGNLNLKLTKLNRAEQGEAGEARDKDKGKIGTEI